MKKHIVTFLALAMLLNLMACTSTDSTKTQSPASGSAAFSESSAVAPEQTEAAAPNGSGEITYPLKNADGSQVNMSAWISIKWGAPYVDHPVINELEKITGVHIDWNETNPDAQAESFNLMIAGGDWPDLIPGLGRIYSGGLNSALNDGVIVDLRSYVETACPHFYSYFTNPDYEIQAKAMLDDEGRLGAVTPINNLKSDYIEGTVIRKDWLDKLGLQEPHTIDEVHNVLTAFKVNYGCTEPILMDSSGSWAELAAALGTQGFSMSAISTGGTHLYLDYKDGKYKSSLTDDKAFYKYLQLLNQYYSEGLIRKDFMSVKEMDMGRQYIGATDVTGRFRIQLDGLQNFYASAVDPDFDVIGTTGMVENTGDLLNKPNTVVTGGGRYASEMCITTNCKNVEAALNWVDYFFTDDGIKLGNYGVKDVSWEDVEGKPQWSTTITENPDYPAATAMEIYVANQFPTFILLDKSWYMFSDKQTAIQDVWKNEKYNTVLGAPSSMSFTQDEMDDKTTKLTDIDTYASENVVKFITGEKPLSQFADFAANIKAMGIDEVLNIYQTAYERYLTR